MESLAEFVRALPGLVEIYGPWVLALMAFLETCFVTGVVVPSGLATSFATVLALGGGPSLGAVAASALAGGFAGDVTGYWIGRRGGEALRQGDGLAARALARHDAGAGRLLSGHPFFSITVARLVAFARTVMPVASGAARVPFAVYLVYEVPGLVAWAGLYMAIGVLAGESWETAGSVVGGGWALVFLVVGLGLWLKNRRRRRKAGTGPSEPAEVGAE